FLANAKGNQPIPKAIIAPHAGYVYSGQTAARAYACLAQAANAIQRIILLGPSHRYPFRGIAVPQADYF
ncbi:MAG: AmmeMemoRadiSam system protein B, partial [Hydrotalea flava]|nr:AmmeMemoRadiSam system protein B [Hydrotalea flava]NIN13959.1 AmmeMemoRadiSam system protein B [Hydrotalea flava]NIO93040.1 AmmeMemoRadiSam system protein B [Hydrotalea flava]NIS91871.1 AmmeMemoRadiSam system protein B [Hydrotalea flava]NIT18428.1 AmmeMemoRadiSam system protein B [Hydrotalea flava]